jgi:hypothetical protein
VACIWDNVQGDFGPLLYGVVDIVSKSACDRAFDVGSVRTFLRAYAVVAYDHHALNEKILMRRN